VKFGLVGEMQGEMSPLQLL